MNYPSKAAVDARKARFKPGSRVELVSMTDTYTDLKPGDRGTVTAVDSIGTVHIQWDCGSTLGAAYGADEIRMLPNLITEEVKKQILAVRATGLCNMFDTIAVQRIAHSKYFYELVCLLADDPKEYSHFILTGKREG